MAAGSSDSSPTIHSFLYPPAPESPALISADELVLVNPSREAGDRPALPEDGMLPLPITAIGCLRIAIGNVQDCNEVTVVTQAGLLGLQGAWPGSAGAARILISIAGVVVPVNARSSGSRDISAARPTSLSRPCETC
jgi:hypothetical protein